MKNKFSDQEAENLVMNIKMLQETGLYEKIDSRISKAETSLMNSLIKWSSGIAAGQLALIIAVIILYKLLQP